MKTITTVALGILLALGIPWAHALKHSLRTDIVVVSGTTLPSLAQQQSEDLLLRSDNIGNTYLYLEQRNGARLVILNVTDPAHIKLAASVETELAHPYDFVQTVDGSLELIRFRDGAGIGFLNFRNAKAPHVVDAKNVVSEPIEMLGDSAYLAAAQSTGIDAINLHGRDVQVVDTRTAPWLVATVAHATREVSRTETGTTFILGDEGLTVIRRLDAEEQYAEHELSMRGN